MPILPIFDTHAHLDLPQFDGDRADCFWRIEKGGYSLPQELDGYAIDMQGVLLPGIDVKSSVDCITHARQSAKLFPAVAIHPNHAHEATEEDWQSITELARLPEVVAIGETGLDRFWDHCPIERQRDFFRRHLELSQAACKPIFIHCRDAWDDLLPILRDFASSSHSEPCGAIHAFSGSLRHAEEAIALGFHISFAGSLTYRNAKFTPLWEAAKLVPAERLLVETDSPFMVPHPYRSKLSRNEPVMAAMVALRLAELRGESVEKIAQVTTENAKRLLRMA